MVNIPIVTLDKIYIRPDEKNIFFLDCTRIDETNEIISRKNKSIEEQMTYKKMLMYLRGAPIVFTIRKTDPGIFLPGYPVTGKADSQRVQ